ncbi:EexN family lipoprotein [Delftia acidovorans]|uniref:EexN family lipoprotein n=1 Tax=Delftia acidovorans TaxID=80866 RepID=A0AAJ2R0G7_DELAC|nr:EexN family lipoprotein [Delftia acidovorans]MDX4953668.1 EexN family lipoprotein [Delftia acidovorans]
MNTVLAIVTALLLAACGESPSSVSVDALANDPVRLKAVRQHCKSDHARAGEALCRAAAEAFRKRFFAGTGGPDEYRTLADLPPIPPSFDEPIAGELP